MASRSSSEKIEASSQGQEQAPARRVEGASRRLLAGESSEGQRPPGLPAEPDVEDIESWLIERLALLTDLRIDEIDPKIALELYGLDSRETVSMTGELEDWLEIELPATLLWDYPTIAEASAYMAREAEACRSANAAGSDTSHSPAAADKS